MHKENDLNKVKEIVLQQLNKSENNLKEFFTVFVHTIEKYPNLSKNDYQVLLNLIQEQTSAQEFPEYQKTFQTLLKYKEKSILKYEKYQDYLEEQAKILHCIQEDFDAIEPSKYSSKTYLKMQHIKTKTEREVQYVLEDSNYKEEFKTIYQSYKIKLDKLQDLIDKAKSKRGKWIGISCGIVGVVLVAFLCIGAIPKIKYCTIEEYNTSHKEQLDYTSSDLLNPNLNESIVVTGISGMIFPFHFSYKNIEIKEKYHNKKVVAIAPKAFKKEKIVRITLPTTLRIIDKEAFKACRGLNQINTNTGNQIVENTFPDQLIRIKELAFYQCSSLKKVTVESSLKSIAGNSFQFCATEFCLNYNGMSTQWQKVEKNLIEFAVQCKSYKIIVHGIDNSILYERDVYPNKRFFIGTPPQIPGYQVIGCYYDGTCIADENGDSFDVFNYNKDINLYIRYRSVE